MHKIIKASPNRRFFNKIDRTFIKKKKLSHIRYQGDVTKPKAVTSERVRPQNLWKIERQHD